MNPDNWTSRADRAPAAPAAVAPVLAFASELAPASVGAPSPLAGALLVLLTMGFAGAVIA